MPDVDGGELFAVYGYTNPSMYHVEKGKCVRRRKKSHVCELTLPADSTRIYICASSSPSPLIESARSRVVLTLPHTFFFCKSTKAWNE